MTLDRLSPSARIALDIVARCAMAWVFLHEAWVKATHLEATRAYMVQAHLPDFLLWPALALEALGGFALILGLTSRWAALALAAFCVATGVMFHLGGDGNQLLHFEKNFAMAGGLLAYGLAQSGQVQPKSRRY